MQGDLRPPAFFARMCICNWSCAPLAFIIPYVNSFQYTRFRAVAKTIRREITDILVDKSVDIVYKLLNIMKEYQKITA